ncbi:hypothetical protein [Haematobacter sp.]|nr:hypothetical protein [Haematobacter sp.]
MSDTILLGSGFSGRTVRATLRSGEGSFQQTDGAENLQLFAEAA